MIKNISYLFFILGAICIIYCKYRVHLIMKKYSDGKSYFGLDWKNFEKEDVDSIKFWRMLAFIMPIIVIVMSFILIVVLK